MNMFQGSLHFANRLMGYEIKAVPSETLIERVKYFYALDGPAAGNVYRIERDPVGDSGQGWCFSYNRAGEIWMITEQSWPIGQPENATVDRLVEVRGSGRERYMIRERDITSPYAPIVDTDLWTVYDDGDLPTQDFTVDGGSRTNVTRYMLGMAQTDEATGDNSFFHTNHLGTSRAMTDDDGLSETTFVFTAFGERVDANGFVTRYGYVGAGGYESFDPPIGGFLHVGARWYDPETGRFLQRDPIGMRGIVDPSDPQRIAIAINVYLYADGQPVMLVDPDGGLPEWVAEVILVVTGGQNSWLDNPRTVRKVQKVLRTVAATSAGAAVLCVGVGFNPWVAKIARHGANHTFRLLGKRKHMQVMIRTGRHRTSHLRIPYGK